MGIIALIMIVASIAIFMKKYSEYMKDHNQQPEIPYPIHQWNNIIENSALMTPCQCIFAMIFMLVTAVPLLVISDAMLIEHPYLVPLKDTPYQLSVGIFFPVLFFTLNETARKHIKIHFWERVPDFFQQFNSDRVYEVKL